MRAERRFGKIIGVDVVGFQDPVTFLLEREILLFQLCHGGGGIFAAAEADRHDAGGRLTQTQIDLAQARLLRVNRRDAAARFIIVLLFGLCKTRLRALQDGFGIRHVIRPPYTVPSASSFPWRGARIRPSRRRAG